MSFIIGFTLSSYLIILGLTMYDIYLSIKLRRVRFEVAQGIFKYEMSDQQDVTILEFDEEPRFLIEHNKQTIFYRFDKFSMYNRDTLYASIMKDILVRFVILMLSPLFMIGMIFGQIGIAISYLMFKLKNNMETKYDLDERIVKYKESHTDWYFGKKSRLIKGYIRIKKHKDHFNKLEAEKMGKHRAAKPRVFAVNFEDNKELI